MRDVIENLNERDDVQRTEYTNFDAEDGKTNIELWHDAEGLQAIFERAMDGTSPRGLQEYAKEQALVVRETHMENVPVKALYPDTMERLKREVGREVDEKQRRESSRNL